MIRKLTIIVVQPFNPQTKIDQENDNEGEIKCIPHLDGWSCKHDIQGNIRESADVGNID